MKTITKTVFAAAILVSIAFSANAQCRPMGRGHGPRDGKGRFMRMAEKLDMSAEQQTEAEKRFAELQQDMEPLRAQLDKVREKIDKLWMANPVNEQALMNAIEKSMRIKTKMRKLRAECHVDLLEVLTPEQQEQFRAHMQNRRGHRGKGRFHGRGRGKRNWSQNTPENSF